jgi:CRP-like cAMP-binding protein
VKNLNPGNLFGEVGLLYKTKRTASVRCKNQCTVGAIESEAFHELVRNYPEIENGLMKGSAAYSDHWKTF